MDHDPGPQPPPHVPGLRLRRRLGRGAHGEVWEAVDLGSGEQVAVKVGRSGRVRPAARAGLPDRAGRAGPPSCGSTAPRDGGTGAAVQDGAQRLAREIALLRRVDHPHVIRLRRVLDLPDGSRALVLDHAAGGSLADLVRTRGPLQPEEVSTLLVALARALTELHARGVVHADLSPGNVLFTADGRPLLSDLGSGTVLGAEPDRVCWATPGFTDPADPPAGDPARDVWGLGAVAWFALTGGPPVAAGGGDPGPVVAGGGDPGPVVAGRDDPDRAALRRAAVFRLVRDCLAAEPDGRPEAAEVVRLAWQAAPPAAIRWIGRACGSGEDPFREITRRVREQARAGGAPQARRTRWVRGTVRAPGQGRSEGPRPARSGGWSPHGGRARAREGSGPAPVRQVVRRPAGLLLAVVGATVLVTIALVTTGGLGHRLPGLPGWSLLPGWSQVVPAVPRAGSDPGSGPEPDPEPDPEDEICRAAEPASAGLAAAVCTLARARAAAFSAASTGPLAGADEPGSPAFAADTGLVHRLQGQGLRLHGVTFAVTQVQVVSRTTSTATVTAAVATSGHQQVRTDGSVAAEIPATGSRTVRLVLVGCAGAPGWRVRSVHGL